jgi:hypothetical protein
MLYLQKDYRTHDEVYESFYINMDDEAIYDSNKKKHLP